MQPPTIADPQTAQLGRDKVAPAEPRPGMDRNRLRARQVKQLYENASLGLAGSVGAALLVSLLVLPYVDSQALAIWLAAIVGTALLRYALIRLQRRSRSATDDATRWLFWFTLTIAISGLAWGAGMYLIHQPGQLLVATLLGLCLGGLVAGSTAAFSSHYPTILAFALPATLPFVSVLLLGPTEEQILGATLALFTLVMLGVAYKITQLTGMDIQREVENQRLIKVLREQKEDIAEFNARLEASVNERTHKLEQQIAVRAQIESALRDSEARFRQIFEHTAICMLVTDLRGRVLDANTQACNTFGRSESNFIGQELLGITHPDDRHLVRHELVVLASGEQAHIEFERRYLRADEGVIWGMVNMTATADSRNNDHYLIVAIQDVTDAKLLAQELSFQANHDALTGLANRHAFEHELHRLHTSAKDSNRQHLLAYLDLDRFKLVNDACGHLAGDELLRQLGQVLQQNCRRGDLVARLGGDEFGILLENTTYDEGLAVIEAATRTIESFSFHWLDRVFSLGVSAGVVTVDRGAGTPTDLLRNADAACYMAKETGRHRIQIHDSQDAELIERQGQMGWINRIEEALQNDRFELYAQPIHSMNSGANNGLYCEVLLRLVDQQGALITPTQFLPAAERYGLCPRIDAWVLRAVYKTLVDCESTIHRLAQCNINLSGQSLSDELLVTMVNEYAHAHGDLIEKVCFEITETSAITNLTRVRQMMLELKTLGCRFALDDFGSGFSSYGYLNDFPVDCLKIDGQFVRDIDRNPVHRAMVRSINEIGHLMGKKTVAEYVENQAVLRQLQHIGVDFAQGWHVGKPRPLRDYLRGLRSVQRA